jgi:hypothetical protein
MGISTGFGETDFGIFNLDSGFGDFSKRVNNSGAADGVFAFFEGLGSAREIFGTRFFSLSVNSFVLQTWDPKHILAGHRLKLRQLNMLNPYIAFAFGETVQKRASMTYISFR